METDNLEQHVTRTYKSTFVNEKQSQLTKAWRLESKRIVLHGVIYFDDIGSSSAY